MPFIYFVVFRMGSYLLVLYLISKLCYIANVVSQLFVLNKVLGMTYSTFGLDMIKYVLLNIAHILTYRIYVFGMIFISVRKRFWVGFLHGLMWEMINNGP